MQLYSVEKKVSQPLTGHAAAFGSITLPGRDDPAQVLVFHQQAPGSPEQKIYVMEVGRDPAKGAAFKLAPTQIPIPQDAAADFPVSLTIDGENSIAFLISKMGYLYMFDMHTGAALYRARISQDTIFSTVPTSNGCILGLTARKGQLLSVSMNKETIVPYIVATLQNNELALKLSGRLSLPGAENLYKLELEKLLASRNITGAAKLAGSSGETKQGVTAGAKRQHSNCELIPYTTTELTTFCSLLRSSLLRPSLLAGNALRTPEIIARFQQLPAQPGQPQPVFIYFSTLLESGPLNSHESIELCKPVLSQGRPQLLEKWLKEDKLACSETLGDLIMPHDVGMALSVYLRASCHSKAITCFAQRGEYAKIVAYSKQVAHTMDYQALLNQLVFSNPTGALELAKALASAEGGPLIDIQGAAETFLASNRIQEATSFLLEALKEDKKEHALLQTKLIEINLIGGAPQVADAIMQNKILSHYDKPHIAKLCERAGLWQRAAENYSDIGDVKRVFKNSHQMDPEFIISFFATLSADDAILLLKDMLSRGASNLQVVVEVSKKYSNELGAVNLIDIFETFKATEGMYYYLGSVVNTSEEKVRSDEERRLELRLE